MCNVLRMMMATMVLIFVAGCANTDEPQSKDESPIERVFDPLDNAVDELNRDLNEGNDEKEEKP